MALSSFATVADLLELPRLPFPGRSLARYWRGDAAVAGSTGGSAGEPDTIASWGTGVAVSLVAGGLHYLELPDGHEELFDLVADPWERSDLARESDSGEALDRFRAYRRELPAGR